MLKLMKYELIKQRTSKVIIGAILALLEVAFLAGMLFMTPYNVYEIMGSKILTGFFSIAAAAIIFGIIGFADITMVCAKYGELQTLFDQMKALFSFTLQMNVDGMLIVWSIIQVVFSWVGMVTSAFLAITLCITIFSGMRCKGLISFVIYCVLNIAVSAVVVQILNWTDMASVNGMMAVFSIFDILFAGACYVATGYILNKELSL